MHILLYTDTPNVGGAEHHMLLLARALKRSGHQVSLAYGSYSKMANLHEDFASVCEEVFKLPVIHKHDPRHFKVLKKILKQGNFDLVHLHLWNPGACRYAFFAANHLGIPVVATEHDPFELRGIKGMIKKNCLSKTAQVIVISQDNYRLLDEYYDVPDSRLTVVHNGIELDRFLDNEDRADLPVQNGDTVITSIAEFHPRKGHRYLIEAFKSVQSKIPNLQLILVGEGPIKSELQEKYKDLSNIHYLGWRDDIPQILKASDVFVLPSLNEAFGLVLLEAMASGVVCIGTNNGGIPDIIKDGETGYLVPPSSSEKLAEAIYRVIQNKDASRDIIKSAQEVLMAEFSVAHMTQKTLEVYQRVI